jgi:hypothetical protein
MAIITFASDYGTADGYAAEVKGVIKTVSPESEIIDITHELTSIFKTAIVLSRYYDDFPAGTIHLVVIDPTVGTSRRALAGRIRDRYFVGPDNGIVTLIAGNGASEWIEIDAAKISSWPISPTFHGRDIFAPAAAMLANGIPLASLGNSAENPKLVSIPKPIMENDSIIGEIIDIDTFGNLIINIRGGELGSQPKIVFEGSELPFARTFADVAPGRPLAYIGSLDYLEIAVNMGRAAELFGASIGSKVMASL